MAHTCVVRGERECEPRIYLAVRVLLGLCEGAVWCETETCTKAGQ
jgi:hypothetical protein